MTYYFQTHDQSLKPINYPRLASLSPESTPILELGKNHYLIYSGLTKNHEPCENLWLYNGNDWKLVFNRRGIFPKPRWKHVIFWDGSHRIFIFGGVTQDQDVIWEFDMNKQKWRHVYPLPHRKRKKRVNRLKVGHNSSNANVKDRNCRISKWAHWRDTESGKLVLESTRINNFENENDNIDNGDNDENSSYTSENTDSESDVKSNDSTEEVDLYNEVGRRRMEFPYRYDFGGFYYDDALWIFGGLDKSQECLNDMWKFSLKDQSWKKLRLLGNIPTPRYGFGYCTDGKKNFWIFSGRPFNNDLWYFNPHKETWTQVIWNDSFPDPVYRPRMYAIQNEKEYDDTIVVEGGINNQFEESSQIWSVSYVHNLEKGMTSNRNVEILSQKSLHSSNLNYEEAISISTERIPNSPEKLSEIVNEDIAPTDPRLKSIEEEYHDSQELGIVSKKSSTLRNQNEEREVNSFTSTHLDESLKEYTIKDQNQQVSHHSEEVPRDPLKLQAATLKSLELDIIYRKSNKEERIDSSNIENFHSPIFQENLSFETETVYPVELPSHRISSVSAIEDMPPESINHLHTKVDGLRKEFHDLKQNILKKVDLTTSIPNDISLVHEGNITITGITKSIASLQEKLSNVLDTVKEERNTNQQSQQSLYNFIIDLQEKVNDRLNFSNKISQYVQVGTMNDFLNNVEDSSTLRHPNPQYSNSDEQLQNIYNSLRIENESLKRNQLLLEKRIEDMHEALRKFSLGIESENTSNVKEDTSTNEYIKANNQIFEEKEQRDHVISLQKEDRNFDELKRTISQLQSEVYKAHSAIKKSEKRIEQAENEKDYLQNLVTQMKLHPYNHLNQTTNELAMYQSSHIIPSTDQSMPHRSTAEFKHHNTIALDKQLKDRSRFSNNNDESYTQREVKNFTQSYPNPISSTQNARNGHLYSHPNQFSKFLPDKDNLTSIQPTREKFIDSLNDGKEAKFYCMALKPFSSKDPALHSFEAGDLLEYIREVDSDIIECVFNGVKAFVYRSYVDSPESVNEM